MNLKNKIYLFRELNYSLIQILCTQASMITNVDEQTVINSLCRLIKHTIFWSSFIFILNDKIRKGWYKNMFCFLPSFWLFMKMLFSIGNSITFLIRSSSTWSTQCNKFSNEAVHINKVNISIQSNTVPASI